ncbi:MAG: alanine dehydrogenase [Lentimicrobiaceae bacterium]|jgi:alanine dehydrogenase|nr:alanine dehydrogenase [Lentimicrobiaceae bacterium]
MMEEGSPTPLKFSISESLMHQTEMLEVAKQQCRLSIGIPSETSIHENRVGLIPEAVGLLVQNGHTVFVQSDAGRMACFTDNEYLEQGATIVHSAREVFQADIVLKIAPVSAQEMEYLKPRQILISSLQISAQNEIYFRQLMAKKVTAIAFEFIRDKTRTLPVIRAMSEIVGNTCIFLAAKYLSDPEYGKGIMFGGFSGITPTEVVIIGAGTVGEFAARAAIGMGALIKVFDNSIYKLRRIQNNLNSRVFTSIINSRLLADSLKTADVVIAAFRSANGRSPLIVTDSMVKNMKEGSVIMDISIDQGGCIETSYITNHTNPAFKKYGVTHYCVPNIASQVPHTASLALSNFFSPVLLRAGDEGGMENLLKNEAGLRMGVYIYNSILTNQVIGKEFNIPSQDVDLLMTSWG